MIDLYNDLYTYHFFESSSAPKISQEENPLSSPQFFIRFPEMGPIYDLASSFHLRQHVTRGHVDARDGGAHRAHAAGETFWGTWGTRGTGRGSTAGGRG